MPNDEHREPAPADRTPESTRRGPIERTYTEEQAPIERGTRAPGERRMTPRRP